MHHPFRDIERVKAEVFASLPGSFRKKGSNEWTAAHFRPSTHINNIHQEERWER